jgi:hypothetical protein
MSLAEQGATRLPRNNAVVDVRRLGARLPALVLLVLRQAFALTACGVKSEPASEDLPARHAPALALRHHQSGLRRLSY